MANDYSVSNISYSVHKNSISVSNNNIISGVRSSKKHRRYWKKTIALTLAPFFLWGIPVHLFYGKQKISSQSQWFKYLVAPNENKYYVAWTMLLFFVSCSVNCYTLFKIVTIFDDLVIKADASRFTFANFASLIQTLPLIFLMDYIWLYGYELRSVIGSFDKISGIIIRPFSMKTPFHLSTSATGRRILLLLYGFLIAIHTLHAVLYAYRRSLANLYFDEGNYFHYKNYVLGPLVYTLIYPVYAVFCLAIQYEVQITAAYLETLMEDKKMVTKQFLDEFKEAYKITADHIVQINDICSLFMSWAYFSTIIGYLPELLGLILNLIGLALFWGAQLPGTADMLRMVEGCLAIIILLCFLFYYTFDQLKKANNSSKYLLVRLNDFVTSPQANLSVELYHSFRALKFYMQSRMEGPTPALLSVPLNMFTPFMKLGTTPQINRINQTLANSNSSV